MLEIDLSKITKFVNVNNKEIKTIGALYYHMGIVIEKVIKKMIMVD